MADEHTTRRPDRWGPTTEHGSATDPGWPETAGSPTPPPSPQATSQPVAEQATIHLPDAQVPGPPTGPMPAPTDHEQHPDHEQPPDHPPRTDELPFGRRVARKVRRGDQRDAVRDAVSTIEAKLHPDFRIGIATGLLAIATVVVQQAVFPVSSSALHTRLIGYGLAVLFLVLGVVASRSTANESARLSQAKGGRSAAAAIRVTALLVGYILTALVTLGMFDVRLGNLLVGGALTGVIIGIAAQQALGNVFAGLVLLFSRPYVPGEQIRVSTGALGGPHDGVVVSVGLTYTVLMTSYGPLNIPNSALLASAIGPQPPTAPGPAADDAPVAGDAKVPADDASVPPARGGAPSGGAPV